jgi:hypothetical protein
MYWTRDILQFFGIDDERDINVYLNFHQVYKDKATRRFSERNSLNQDFSRGRDRRAGSYWSGLDDHMNFGDNNEDGII